MCGRIAQGETAEAVARRLGVTERVPGQPPSWNMAPGQSVMVVASAGKKERAFLRPVWGFLPPWENYNPELIRNSPINARAETVAGNRLFGRAFRTARCLVPVTAWYEWAVRPDGPKQPYAMGPAGREILTLGGILSVHLDPWKYKSYYLAIITTAAPSSLASIHARAPLVIAEADHAVWLGQQKGEPAGLLNPVAGEMIEAWMVDRGVNDPANNGAQLLERCDELSKARGALAVADTGPA
jgi:putative SOS response-associated peptidase YedK